MEVLKIIGLVVLTGLAIIFLVKDLSGMTPSQRKKMGRRPFWF
ncbi:MAG: hypothetical protein OXL96_06910 [Candidatus Poribacteria bacterium]|nr:hypothetical protein [Candidatus Poribacteria bacterium]